MLASVLNKRSRQFVPQSLQFKRSRQTKGRKRKMTSSVPHGVSSYPFHFVDLTSLLPHHLFAVFHFHTYVQKTGWKDCLPFCQTLVKTPFGCGRHRKVANGHHPGKGSYSVLEPSSASPTKPPVGIQTVLNLSLKKKKKKSSSRLTSNVLHVLTNKDCWRPLSCVGRVHKGSQWPRGHDVVGLAPILRET